MDAAEIQKLAEMVRIELSDEDSEHLRDDLTRILGYFESLSEVETSDIPATARIFEGYSELRDDAVTPGLAPADLESMAKDFDPAEGTFRLQGVFDSTDR